MVKRVMERCTECVRTIKKKDVRKICGIHDEPYCVPCAEWFLSGEWSPSFEFKFKCRACYLENFCVTLDPDDDSVESEENESVENRAFEKAVKILAELKGELHK